MNTRFHHRMVNTVEALQECFRQLEASPLHESLNPRQRNALFLVLDEMISNTIKFAGRSDVRIEVDLTFDGEVLVIDIADDAHAFDPWIVPPPPEAGPLDVLPIGGRGIHIVRQATASREHTYTNGRNHLRMTVT